jgi:hypothetical protein
LGQVEALYEEVLWPRLVALDDAAREAAPEDVVEVQMAVLWAPSEDEPLP